MEKVAVIVNSKIVDNYSGDTKKPYGWNFTLNYLENNSLVSVDVKYYDDYEYNTGNVVLYDISSNKIFDIGELSLEQVKELELIREIYCLKYIDLEKKMNIGDSKLDNATVKFFNHKSRVNASLSIDLLKRILSNLDNDIEVKKMSKVRK